MRKVWIYLGILILGLLTMTGAVLLNDPQGLKVAGGFIVGCALVFLFIDLFEGD